MLCVGVLGEDNVSLVTTEGQLLVRFPDGTIHACDQQHAFVPFVQDGVHLEWCAALAFARTSRPMAVAAVRAPEGRRVVGSTFPVQTTLTEAHAREVIDAHGGVSRVHELDAPSALRREAKAAPSPKEAEGFHGPNAFTSILSMHLKIPTIDLEAFEVDPEILRLVPQALCAKHTVLPISRAGDSLIVAFADPKDALAVEALKAETGLTVEPVVATSTAIRAAIERSFAR